jgi:AAA+ ATPase superfamily predicted ATPase
MAWGFYGRQEELSALKAIMGRQRWFFARIQGRRRIGKTLLIQNGTIGDGARITPRDSE